MQGCAGRGWRSWWPSSNRRCRSGSGTLYLGSIHCHIWVAAETTTSCAQSCHSGSHPSPAPRESVWILSSSGTQRNKRKQAGTCTLGTQNLTIRCQFSVRLSSFGSDALLESLDDLDGRFTMELMRPTVVPTSRIHTWRTC